MGHLSEALEQDILIRLLNNLQRCAANFAMNYIPIVFSLCLYTVSVVIVTETTVYLKNARLL